MGRSNITANMERELAYQLGERADTMERIERIESLNETLPGLRERLGMLDVLIKSAECLLLDRNPNWALNKIQPTRRWKHQSPIEFGRGVRTALEVLMSATRPLSTRQITDEVLAREAKFDLDKATWEKVRTNIDAGLRNHQKNGTVASSGHKPILWWIIGNPSVQVTEQMLLRINTDSRNVK